MRLLHATAVVIAAATIVGAQAPKPGERLAVARPRCRRAAILAAQADQHDRTCRISSWCGPTTRLRRCRQRRLAAVATEEDRRTRAPPPARGEAPAASAAPRDSGATAVGGHTARGRRRHVHGDDVQPRRRAGCGYRKGNLGQGHRQHAVDAGHRVLAGDERHSAAAGLWHGRRIVAADFAERQNRRVHTGIRTRRQGRLAAGRRREVSEAAGRAVVAAGDLQEPRDHRQSLAGGSEPRTVGRRACVGSADGQARLDVSHDSQAG